ncbi:MAG TPA: GNAT family N-acetyltransferase [Planococcus sp. (in: firmicutes)]|nr:GNAT family N-acetyltransferase [Planococcus sp. (in: firmicutes)]
MLIRYKKAYEKIAMGMLSFMPQEHNLKQLQQTMSLYNGNTGWQLFMMKKENTFIGLIGAEIFENHYIIRHLSVVPSYRGEGVARNMIENLESLMKGREMRATSETYEFLSNFIQKELKIEMKNTAS